MCKFLRLLWIYSRFLFLLSFEKFLFLRNYPLKFSCIWYEVYFYSIRMTDLTSTIYLSMFFSLFLIGFILCFLFFLFGEVIQRFINITSLFKEQQQQQKCSQWYLRVISIIFFIFLCILQNFPNKCILTIWTSPIITVIKLYTSLKQNKEISTE